jgi:hypothetical protein
MAADHIWQMLRRSRPVALAGLAALLPLLCVLLGARVVSGEF